MAVESPSPAVKLSPRRTPGVPGTFLDKSVYHSEAFARLENERLWPAAWQMVCREQDLESVGSFVTYDILDETVVVLRSSDTEIKAFYNVCQHRGRRLLEGCGKTQRLFCKYHGWRWKLDGSIDRIPWRDDFTNVADADVALEPVKVGLWQGWVFISLDPDVQPLEDYLRPISAALAPFRQDQMRYRWRRSVMLDANWKVALEAFMEAYHAQCTHNHMEPYSDGRTVCDIHGLHGMFRDSEIRLPLGVPSPLTDLPTPDDLRPNIAKFFEQLDVTLQALVTPADARGAQRILTEVPEDAEFSEIMVRLGAFQHEEALKEGIERPPITYDDVRRAGQDWHIFPNMVLLPAPDSFLVYRSRPDGRNVDRCRFDVFVLQRYGPGQEPDIDAVTQVVEDWRDADWPKIFEQDFINIADVHSGMKSSGFRGSVTNPIQEAVVANFHRQLKRVVVDGEAVVQGEMKA